VVSETVIVPLWRGRALALVGILLVGLNLRTAVAALSPIFAEISVDVPLGSLSIGLLGMLPPVCFTLFGIAAPMLHRRFGLERVLVAALVAMLVGHLVRSQAENFTVLAGASALTFAGMGVANVLLPPLVKKYFPDRIGLLTSLYATSMAIGATLPPLLAVPLAMATGWRLSVGLWGVFALLSILPWLSIIISRRSRLSGPADVAAEEAEPEILGRVWRSRIAWSLMLVFAFTGLNAYSMFAWLPAILAERTTTSAAEAGAMLALYAGMGLPASLLIPLLAGHLRSVGLVIYAGVLFYVLGYLGLLVAPNTLTWLWVALAGLGPMLFPLSLVLINMRTRTHEGSVALSGFVQGVGYGIAALGPVVLGVLHQVSDGWTLPLAFLLLTALMIVVAGLVVSRPRMLEDDWLRGARATDTAVPDRA
jgi:CP family cyanate transporter-like MFS transporter